MSAPAFCRLPHVHQEVHADVSLQELAAFCCWRRESFSSFSPQVLALVQDNPQLDCVIWDIPDVEVITDWVPSDPRAFLVAAVGLCPFVKVQESAKVASPRPGDAIAEPVAVQVGMQVESPAESQPQEFVLVDVFDIDDEYDRDWALDLGVVHAVQAPVGFDDWEGTAAYGGSVVSEGSDAVEVVEAGVVARDDVAIVFSALDAVVCYEVEAFEGLAAVEQKGPVGKKGKKKRGPPPQQAAVGPAVASDSKPQLVDNATSLFGYVKDYYIAARGGSATQSLWHRNLCGLLLMVVSTLVPFLASDVGVLPLPSYGMVLSLVVVVVTFLALDVSYLCMVCGWSSAAAVYLAKGIFEVARLWALDLSMLCRFGSKSVGPRIWSDDLLVRSGGLVVLFLSLGCRSWALTSV